LGVPIPLLADSDKPFALNPFNYTNGSVTLLAPPRQRLANPVTTVWVLEAEELASTFFAGKKTTTNPPTDYHPFMTNLYCETVGPDLESLEQNLKSIDRSLIIDPGLLSIIKADLKRIVDAEDRTEAWIAYRLLCNAEALNYKRPAESTLKDLKLRLYGRAGLDQVLIEDVASYWAEVEGVLAGRATERQRRKKAAEENAKRLSEVKPITQDEVDFALGAD
jgi:hypothetical protein